MCSLRFENNLLTFEGVRFASISKKTPLSKLSFAFVSLALPLLKKTLPSISESYLKKMKCKHFRLYHKWILPSCWKIQKQSFCLLLWNNLLVLTTLSVTLFRYPQLLFDPENACRKSPLIMQNHSKSRLWQVNRCIHYSQWDVDVGQYRQITIKRILERV